MSGVLSEASWEVFSLMLGNILAFVGASWTNLVTEWVYRVARRANTVPKIAKDELRKAYLA